MHHTRVLFCLALTISIIAVFANTYGDPLNEGSEFPAITSRRKRSSEELLDESLMVQLLSHMEKAPQMLSQERMNSLRDGIPSKVEEFLEFINNERLLKAVSEGLVKDRDYNELLFSLILLNTSK